MSPKSFRSNLRQSWEAEEFLNTVPMLQAMKPFERKRLAPFLIQVQFQPGAVIMREGDAADAMYFVRQGSAEASMASKGALRSYESGGYFGELALLMGTDRAATVTATGGGVSCFRLDAGHFRDVPKYVRRNFMHHAARDYVRRTTGGAAGAAAAPPSKSSSERELLRYLEATLDKGRLRPPSQRNLDGGDSSSSESSASDSDSDVEEGDAPADAGALRDPPPLAGLKLKRAASVAQAAARF